MRINNLEDLSSHLIDNWKSGKTATRKGIWGQNLSYKYGKYHIQYCRFDEGNLVNSLATIIHEQIWHPADALAQVEIGVDLNRVVGVIYSVAIGTNKRPAAIWGYFIDLDPHR